MTHYHPDDDAPVPASTTLAEVKPPAPHPFWLTLLATMGGLVIPAIAAIAAAVLLGPPRLPHTSKAASLAAAALTIAEAIFAGLGAAALVEAGWRQLGLPGSGPANFLPLRWIRHRIAHRNVQIIIDRLRQNPAAPSRDSLKALLDLSRELARRDIYTRAHSGRVSRLSVEVGQRIGLSPEECEMARLAGLLHDIGKLEIPPSILNKPGPLDPDEAELVRHHPMIGAALVAPYIGTDVVNAVRHHHERVDGAGYPDGVDGDALPIIARLVPVVDTYDALISDRAYRPGRSREEAFMELRAVAGTQLDADLVEALIEVEKAKVPFGGALLGLAPVSGLVRRAEHLLHGSAAPAAAAVTAIAVAGAGWLGVMSNTAGSHFLASRDAGQSIVKASPSSTTDGTESPAPAVAVTDTASASPVPSPSDGGTGKTVAPLYFPLASGKATGKNTGSQGVLVTPPTATKNASGTKTPSTVVAVGPPNVPIKNPGGGPSNTPAPGTTSQPPPPGPSAPSVSGVSPSSGPSGIQVTISGSNFTGATAVRFGNVAASGVSTAAAGTQITVTVPPGTGTQSVTVTGPGGTSGTGVSFRYVGPGINTVSPLFGGIGGGTSVVLSGSSFTGTTKVTFGNQNAQSFVVDSDSQITAIAPAFSVQGPQEVDVLVTTPVGTSNAAPNDQQFDWGPGITGASPGNGQAGTSVSISGINFTGATTVNFGGKAATSFSVVDDGHITAVAPVGGGSVDLQVLTPAGHSDCCAASFSYGKTSISGLSPNNGPGGTAVTISGAGFSGATSVKFGTSAAAFTVLSDGQISTSAPTGVFGVQTVVVVSPAGNASAPFTYPPPPPPPPTVSGMTPATGSTLVATPSIINGANFLPTMTCFIGTAAAACTVTSSTTISITMPAGGTGAVTVGVTNGTQSATTTFTYGP